MTMTQPLDPVAEIAARDPEVLALVHQSLGAPVQGSVRLEAISMLTSKALKAPFKCLSLEFERVQVHSQNSGGTVVVLVARGEHDWSGDLAAISKSVTQKRSQDEGLEVVSPVQMQRLAALLEEELGFAAKLALQDALGKLGVSKLPKSQVQAFIGYLNVSKDLRSQVGAILEEK
jgi:hypothetical protein